MKIFLGSLPGAVSRPPGAFPPIDLRPGIAVLLVARSKEKARALLRLPARTAPRGRPVRCDNARFAEAVSVVTILSINHPHHTPFWVWRPVLPGARGGENEPASARARLRHPGPRAPRTTAGGAERFIQEFRSRRLSRHFVRHRLDRRGHNARSHPARYNRFGVDAPEDGRRSVHDPSGRVGSSSGGAFAACLIPGPDATQRLDSSGDRKGFGRRLSWAEPNALSCSSISP